jgi:hypothetical protein
MPYTVLYSVRDGKGATSTTELNLPDSITLDNARIFAAEMGKLIDNLITGAIVRIGLVLSVDLPSGIATNPDENSDVEEGARFQWRTQNGFYSGMRLPTFDEANIVAGSRDVDQAASPVAAFVLAMLDGINLVGAGGSGKPNPCDKRGEDIVALEFAREQFLSSR